MSLAREQAAQASVWVNLHCVTFNLVSFNWQLFSLAWAPNAGLKDQYRAAMPVVPWVVANKAPMPYENMGQVRLPFDLMEAEADP